MALNQDAFIDHGFTIKRELGRGCWGITYLAEDEKGQACCIKSEHDRTRAETEAQAIHDVYDYPSKAFLIDGMHYFAMPYVKGTTLRKAIHQGLSLVEKISIAVHLKEKMLELHEKGYIHRDITLDNVMYDPNNPTSPVELIDLGRSVTAKQENRQLDHYALRLFFQPQTAPEYITRGNIGAHSDIYSFGCIFHGFFPEIRSEIAGLYAHYDFEARRTTLESIKQPLVLHFNQKRNELIASCTAILASGKACHPDTLKALKQALEEAELDDDASINALQQACSDNFSEFSATGVYDFVIKIYELLTYFCLVKQEDVLQLKMRAFTQPGLEAAESEHLDLRSHEQLELTA